MNNPKRKKGIAEFLAGKGFYIILFLCVSAIGISAYVLFSGGGPLGSDGEITLSDVPSGEPGGEVAVMNPIEFALPSAQPKTSAAPAPTLPGGEASAGVISGGEQSRFLIPPTVTPKPKTTATPSASPSPSAKPEATAKPGASAKPSPSAKPAESGKPTSATNPEVPAIPEATARPAEPAHPESHVPDSKSGKTLVKASAAAALNCVWPVSGGVVSAFSKDELQYDKTLDDWRVHTGLDLEAPLGSKVVAMAPGTVDDIYVDELAGVTVLVNHGNDVFSVYSNLKAEPRVAIGQQVKAGELIGAVGNTSTVEASEPSHLHFEVIESGEQIDPTTILPRLD